MTLTYATLTIDLPFAESKKGRRSILNSIKERLSHMNCSVLDISGEYPKEAQIAVAYLSPSEQEAKQKIEKIETLLQNRFPDIHAEITYDYL